MASCNTLMPIKKGQRLGGVYSLDDLKTRIEIDEFTDCWHLLKANGQRFTGPRATIWYAPKRRTMLSVYVTWLLANPGKSIPKGKIAYRTCSCFDCVNPDHIRIGTRADLGAAVRKNGSQRTIAKINCAITNSRKHAKISEETKTVIAKSDKTVKQLSEEYGISTRYIRTIQSKWNAKNSPFAQLYNFAMKAAA